MTTIKITTSQSMMVVEVASPLDETVEIDYRECLYCGVPFRKRAAHQKFKHEKCRKLYHALHIHEPDAPRLTGSLPPSP